MSYFSLLAGKLKYDTNLISTQTRKWILVCNPNTYQTLIANLNKVWLLPDDAGLSPEGNRVIYLVATAQQMDLIVVFNPDVIVTARDVFSSAR